MGMVSVKNLIAPATNTVNLVTIVFIALLFGVWRWSGGELSTRSNTKLAPTTKVERTVSGQTVNMEKILGEDGEDTETEIKKLAASEQKARPVAKTAPVAQSDDLLDEMLKGENAGAGRPAKGVEERKLPPKTRKDGGGGLEDIEKTLGLK